MIAGNGVVTCYGVEMEPRQAIAFYIFTSVMEQANPRSFNVDTLGGSSKELIAMAFREGWNEGRRT